MYVSLHVVAIRIVYSNKRVPQFNHDFGNNFPKVRARKLLQVPFKGNFVCIVALLSGGQYFEGNARLVLRSKHEQ